MQGEDRLALSQKERDRLREIHAVIRGRLKTAEAAAHLGLSRRQVRRLLKRVKGQGDGGVLHGLRGRPSNRKIGAGVRDKAMKLLAGEAYHDFGPTLASEHLARIGIQASRETVRGWMVQAGLWRARREKVVAVHVWRQRRAAFGELVLMDTSDHDWLESRGPAIDLVAMIDDATSRLWARFVASNSTAENLRTLGGWLKRYGRPLALYTDKHSIFRTNRSRQYIEQYGVPPPTDFTAALEELRIEWIPAHSPQAKGRVERAFETLQDRLLKEMRIARVCDLEAANRFLEENFIPFWNRRFTRAPRSPHNAHRPVGSFQLDSVLCHRYERVVTADYTLSVDGQRWGLGREHVRPGLRHARVLVELRLDGSAWIRHRGHHLPLRSLPTATPPTASPSGLRPPGPAARPKPPAGKWRPPKDHPWRKQIHADITKQLAKRTPLLGGKADTSTLR
jgi:DNA-binding Lrp family transcriptional regulator